MPHDITVRSDGTAEAAFAVTPAWHGLGVVLDKPMTSEEAIMAANLQWEVGLKPMFVQSQDGFVPVREARALVRTDNDTVLAVVRQRYKPIQNVDAFRVLDKLVDDGVLTYEAAFSLRGGKKVVLLARLPERLHTVIDDEVAQYVFLLLQHGTGCVVFGPTAVRIVCANTLAVALGEGLANNSILKIPHRGDTRQRLERAVEAVRASQNILRAIADCGRQLAERRFSREDWTRFLDAVLPAEDTKSAPRRAKAVSQVRDTLSTWFLDGHATIQPSVAHTAWAAVNCVTYYVDHEASLRKTKTPPAERRFEFSQVGVGHRLKWHALHVACDMAGVRLAL